MYDPVIRDLDNYLQDMDRDAKMEQYQEGIKKEYLAGVEHNASIILGGRTDRDFSYIDPVMSAIMQDENNCNVVEKVLAKVICNDLKGAKKLLQSLIEDVAEAMANKDVYGK